MLAITVTEVYIETDGIAQKCHNPSLVRPRRGWHQTLQRSRQGLTADCVTAAQNQVWTRLRRVEHCEWKRHTQRPQRYTCHLVLFTTADSDLYVHPHCCGSLGILRCLLKTDRPHETLLSLFAFNRKARGPLEVSAFALLPTIEPLSGHQHLRSPSRVQGLASKL